MKWKMLLQNISRPKIYGLADQAMVSGGTFLTIAICARSLPLTEQGKLGYAISIYLAVLLANLAILFQGASVRVPHEVNKQSYRSMLLVMQYGFGLLLIAITWAALSAFGVHIGWEPTLIETVYFLLFLLAQQIADFERRAAYIFADEKQAMNVSLRIYPLRIIALVVFQPENIEQALMILLLSALAGSIGACQKVNRPRHFGKHELAALLSHLKFSAWLIASAPFGVLWSYTPVFVLGLIEGPASVAILVSIRSLANVANVLMEMVETQAPVYMAKKALHEGKVATDQTASYVLRIGGSVWLSGLVIIAVAGSQIIGLIFGHQYVQYAPLLLLLWIAHGPYFVTRVQGLKHRSFHNMHIEFWGGAAAVLAACIVTYPLVRNYGIYGAGSSFIAISMFSGLSQMYVISRLERGSR